jgi:hypothetical protein
MSGAQLSYPGRATVLGPDGIMVETLVEQTLKGTMLVVKKLSDDLVFVQRRFLDVLAERDEARRDSEELGKVCAAFPHYVASEDTPSQVVTRLVEQLAETQRAHSASEAHLRETILELRDVTRERDAAQQAMSYASEQAHQEWTVRTKAEADLAALQARRCGNCADWSEDEATFVHGRWHKPCESERGNLVNVLLPADFGCVCWRAKEAK